MSVSMTSAKRDWLVSIIALGYLAWCSCQYERTNRADCKNKGLAVSLVLAGKQNHYWATKNLCNLLLFMWVILNHVACSAVFWYHCLILQTLCCTFLRYRFSFQYYFTNINDNVFLECVIMYCKLLVIKISLTLDCVYKGHKNQQSVAIFLTFSCDAHLVMHQTIC